MSYHSHTHPLKKGRSHIQPIYLKSTVSLLETCCLSTYTNDDDYGCDDDDDDDVDQNYDDDDNDDDDDDCDGDSDGGDDDHDLPSYFWHHLTMF